MLFLLLFFIFSSLGMELFGKLGKRLFTLNDEMYYQNPYFVYIFHIFNIFTRCKFNMSIVLRFGPVQIKASNRLFTNKLDKIYTSDYNKLSTKLKIFVPQLSQP